LGKNEIAGERTGRTYTARQPARKISLFLAGGEKKEGNSRKGKGMHNPNCDGDREGRGGIRARKMRKESNQRFFGRCTQKSSRTDQTESATRT